MCRRVDSIYREAERNKKKKLVADDKQLMSRNKTGSRKIENYYKTTFILNQKFSWEKQCSFDDKET